MCQPTSVKNFLDLWLCGRRQVLMIVLLAAVFLGQSLWSYGHRFKPEHLSQASHSKYLSPHFQQSSLKRSSKATSEKEEEQGEEDRMSAAAVTGSLSTQLGYSNPYTYDQFSLQTTEQRINQIILLQVGTCCKNSHFSTCVKTAQNTHLSKQTIMLETKEVK